MYPAELTAPMAQELNKTGVQSLHSAQEVETVLGSKEGTVLVVVNSVCGCAAANARPAVIQSLSNDKTPDNSYTVFAGVDREATDSARAFMRPYPPSSPSIALFKDGKLVHMLERHHIEGATAAMIADNLKSAFDQYC
jgi:putative YphP/YqiW family bacilliredoxin